VMLGADLSARRVARRSRRISPYTVVRGNRIDGEDIRLTV
jgi:hypothetical protein